MSFLHTLGDLLMESKGNYEGAESFDYCEKGHIVLLGYDARCTQCRTRFLTTGQYIKKFMPDVYPVLPQYQ